MFDLLDLRTDKRIALHILLWAGLYVFWIFVFQNATITVSRTMQIQFCYLVFIAANYYFNIYFAIPRYLNKQRYVLFIVTGILFLIASAWMRSEVVLFINAYFYNTLPSQINFSKLYVDSLLNIFIWALCLLAVKAILERIRFQRYALMAEKEKVKNELDFLRAQNNPHFLFNALNSVYFQIDKNNKEARGSLMRLSEILRYQLYDCNTELVPIEKELIFLTNYIELHKLRLDSGFHISVSIGHNVKGFMIVPMLIMPLVENAFKYVSHHTDRVNAIKIDLDFADGVFICEVFNTIEKELSGHTSESGGIGLKNLNRRLELLYPDRYKIETKHTDESFLIKLTLKINENQLHSSGR